MLEKLAILIIDLSGYTALTELHGGKKASAIVRQFEEIVRKNVIDQCDIFERKGDELLITSLKSSSLVDLVMNLAEEINETTYFPSFHAGMHYGEIYRDNNQLFGTTINLTSRIQGHSKSGEVLISDAFFESLGNDRKALFKESERVRFKNISNHVKLYKLVHLQSYNETPIDPVCRMQVVDSYFVHRYENQITYHFCSKECLTVFKNDPVIYTHPNI